MKRSFLVLFLSTALAFIGLWGCNEDVLPDIPNINYSIIDGDRIRTTKSEIARFTSYSKTDKSTNYGDTVLTFNSNRRYPTEKAADVSKLKRPNSNQPFRYVALGGDGELSMGSGFMMGGISREGQLLSYPSLLAKQFGINDFEPGLFSPNEYNGSGRKVLAKENYTGTNLPKYKQAANNLAKVRAVNLNKPDFEYLTKIGAGKLDNYCGYSFSYPTLGSQIVGGEGHVGPRISNGFNTRLEFSKGNKTKSIDEEIRLRKDIDFFTIELGVLVSSDNPYKYNGELAALKEFTERGLKGVVIIAPEFLVPPIYRKLTWEQVLVKSQAVSGTIYQVTEAGGGRAITLDNYFKVFPTSEIDSLVSERVHLSLKKGLTTKNPLGSFEAVYDGGWDYNYNRLLEKINDSNKSFPVVDINKYISYLIENEVGTVDGVIVDASFPSGNLYSSDGISLSPLGQALVTNEIVRAINKFYGTNISLINTRAFL